MTDYKIIKDPDYQYLRLEPKPTQEEVERFYQEEFYSAKNTMFNNSALSVQLDEKEFLDTRWNALYTRCQQYFNRNIPLSLFDIGFGYAQALLYFNKRGMIVSGLEPNAEGIDYARSHGLDVIQGGVEEIWRADKKRFDIVTLLNVLEHLRDPVETITNIREQLLKKDGLLIIETPNEFNDFQTVANAEYSLNEWWICSPKHINYFSVDSLTNLLVTQGYKIVHCESSFPLEIFLLFGDVYINNPGLGKTCHEKRVLFERLMKKHGKTKKLEQFYMMLAQLNLGRVVTIYATPNRTEV